MLGSEYQIPLAEELQAGSVLGPRFYVGAPSINGNSAPTPDDAERLVHAQAVGEVVLTARPGDEPVVAEPAVEWPFDEDTGIDAPGEYVAPVVPEPEPEPDPIVVLELTICKGTDCSVEEHPQE